MTASVTRPPTRVLSHEQVETYQREGYHLARQLFTPAEIAEIRDTFMAMGAKGPVEGLSETMRKSAPNGYDAADPLAFYPRMMQPHRHPDKPVGPVAMKYMLDPRLEAHLTDLFGDEPLSAQSMFYFKPPGARGQDFHQDNFYLRVKPGTCMAAWIAVDDCDAANGGMMVVPTSNTMEIVCPGESDPKLFFTSHHVDIPEGLKAVTCVMKAGDVLFFNGSIIHGSYPNTTKDRFRRSLICHYVPRGCAEVSHYYRPLLTFKGEEVGREAAEGGGPCGELQNAVKGRH